MPLAYQCDAFGIKYGLTQNEFLNAKSTRIVKQALAWLMKKNTAVTVKWIAERTKMGHA